jgi:hypothetical protein
MRRRAHAGVAPGWIGAGTIASVLRPDDEEIVPFRWDLITPDRLGGLLAGAERPDPWFLPQLVACAGKVTARSGDGDLVFVGRSLDSMFDFLGGALADVSGARSVRRLPLSFSRTWVGTGRRRRRRALTSAERAQARRMLAALDITPYTLARRDRPVTFVDVVHAGSTFTELFQLLRGWIRDEHAEWPIIRRKLRFVGVTSRTQTSPKAYRWQQHREWPGQLPGEAVVNVSLDPVVWSYFGDYQDKLTRSHRPEHWLLAAPGPDRDARTCQALAEAVALVAFGRSGPGRRALAAAMRGEPALAQPWLRTLITRLNASP